MAGRGGEQAAAHRGAIGTVLVAELAPALAALWLVALPGLAQAAVSTLYVDNGNPSCSDSGSGTQGKPYCTIVRAAAVAVAGQTVVVASGSYDGQILVKHSGAQGSPITFTPAPGAQVTVTSSTGRGFYLSGTSWITVSGFTVTRTTSYGVYASNATGVVVTGNDVSYAGAPVSGSTAPGIRLNNVTDSQVSGNVVHHNSDSGIQLTEGSGVLVTHNEAYANARGYTRAAPGIDVRSGPNTVSYNISHDNEDSGLQFYTGAHDNLVLANVSYRNGDHGIDDLNAPGQTIVGNSVYRNITAGINLEGNSPGGRLANNVSVDNGINSPRTSSNIRLDSASISGASIDYDQVALSAGTIQFIWGMTGYTSLAAFRAAHPDQEAHGVQADPGWVDRAGGNFHLTAGSPAIDSADSGAPGEPAVDVDGAARADDPATVNTGAGLRAYDDRGAYEYQPVGGGAQAKRRPAGRRHR